MDKRRLAIALKPRFVVADERGDVLSVIQSIYKSFGSTVVPPETGVVLHNRGGYFNIDPAHPKKVTRLTRDGKAGGPVYLSPSLSTKGTKLSFVKGNRLYLAHGNATHARRVDEPVGTAVTRSGPRQHFRCPREVP